MKKLFCLILIPVFALFVFSSEAAPIQQSGGELLKKGIDLFNKAYFEEAVKNLLEALNFDLSNAGKIKAHLHIALAQIALNRSGEANSHIQAILKIDPIFAFTAGEYPPDVEKIFNDVSASFPVVFDLAVLPATFTPYASPGVHYPYNKNMPSVSFKISAADDVNIQISDGVRTLFSMDRKCSRMGEETLQWPWSDSLLRTDYFTVRVTPSLNAASGFVEKKVRIDVRKPEGLQYTDGEFQIAGRDFLPEAKTIKRGMTTTSLVTFGILGTLGTFGAITFISKGTAGSIALGVFTGCLAYTCFNLIFSKKARARLSIESVEKKKVYKENIRKNKELREAIDELKTRVSVTQAIDQ